MATVSRRTAAVLCALALVPGGPTPAAGTAQTVVPCELGAWVEDPDPRGLNVRTGPGTRFPVIAVLPGSAENSVEVEVTGASGNWLRIENATTPDSMVFRGPGWVYAQMLGTRTSDLEPVSLYREPRRGSAVVGRLGTGTSVTLLGCRGGWARVRVASLTGWLDPGSQCSLTQTNCS